MNTVTPKRFVSRTYKEQAFDLHGLDGISDAQIEEHLALGAGYVKQVNTLNDNLAGMTGRGQGSAKHPELGDLTRHLGFEYGGRSSVGSRLTRGAVKCGGGGRMDGDRRVAVPRTLAPRGR